MTDSSSLVEGLVFPNREEMAAYVRQWSLVNLSPVAMSTKKSFVYFRCPHKLKKKTRGTGKRRPNRNLLEYADCPFLVRMTGNNSDGSFTVTKAETEHRGHEVSELQFKKYSQKRRGDRSSAQRNVLMPRRDESEKVSEEEREHILKDNSLGEKLKECQEHKEANAEMEVNDEGEAQRLPLAKGDKPTSGSNFNEYTNKSTDDENKMLSKGLSSLEDEICLDEMGQEKRKPKKVISTKDRHSFFNFFNMKEKEREEVEEKVKSGNLKSREEEKNERVAKEKLKEVFKLIW